MEPTRVQFQTAFQMIPPTLRDASYAKLILHEYANITVLVCSKSNGPTDCNRELFCMHQGTAQPIFRTSEGAKHAYEKSAQVKIVAMTLLMHCCLVTALV